MAKGSTKTITTQMVGYPVNNNFKDLQSQGLGSQNSVPNSLGSLGSLGSLASSLRSMTISRPTAKENTIQSNLRSNIILVAKYAFTSESPNELTVRQGDVLKLLDRPGNGWLLVKFIDRLVQPGLVPAFYVDIAINDPKNPITLHWLQLSQQSSLNLMNEKSYLQIQLKQSLTPPLTINNKAYPLLILISNFLLFNKRYWYRLDVINSDGTKLYVCRYYQDFYNLHVQLVQWLNMSSAPVGDTLRLPKLPEPIPGGVATGPSSETSEIITNQVHATGDQINLLLKRCNDLNVYINRLILNKNYQLSEIIIDWLDDNYKELPGFTVPKADIIDNEAINEKMLPGSFDVIKEYYKKKQQDEIILETDEENPAIYAPSSPPQRTKSRKNIFNHYQQGGNANNTTVVQRTKSRGAIPPPIPNTPVPNYTYRSKSTSSNSSSLTESPTTSPDAARSPHLKCKIMNYHNEIVAIRLNKLAIRSVFEFKRLLKQKIYFTKLFIKIPTGDNFENIDDVHNLIEKLRELDKVFLKIA